MLLRCLGDRSSSQKQYPTVIEELCRQFSLADLRKSTNNFDQNRVIGGVSSSKVYKGCLQHDDASNYTVAVKRFNVKDSQACERFKKEIELLCQLRHPNIISLIGFCDHKKEKILVYEYMSNGALDRQLLCGELSWKKRLKICIGAARGLHYLHAGAKRTIIHRDICLSTILLDDDMEPKLAGVGLSILGARFMSKPKPIKVDLYNHSAGTIGHVAMEYFRSSTITDKCDVYSFGVVLLEVVCGRSYILLLKELLEKPVEVNIDPNIQGNIAPECWEAFKDIIIRCMKYEPDERPTMGEVEVQLEHCLSLQEQADITNTNGNYTLFSTTIIPR